MNKHNLEQYYKGNDIHAYDVFGAHLCTERNKDGVRFTTFAPHAKNIQVIGSFDDWSSCIKGRNDYNPTKSRHECWIIHKSK